MTEPITKPHRPLGVSLAIIMCGGLFALIPLLHLGMQLLIQARLSNIANTQVVLPDGQIMQAVVSGGYENIVDPVGLAFQVGVCVWVLAICVLAWRGKPRGVRWVFTATVLTLAGLSAYLTLRALFVAPDITQGISSADAVEPWEWGGAIFSTILLPVYTLWYMNRAPARAFFAGRTLNDTGRELRTE